MDLILFTKCLNLLNRLGLIKNELRDNLIRKYDLLFHQSGIKTIYGETELLGESFYFEPLRTSYHELIGPSGLVKIYSEDNYNLKLLGKRKHPVILDVGSHVGIFPRVIKHFYPDAEIFSLEPDKENFLLLKLNNQNLTKTKSFQLGVFKEDCEITLRTSNQNSWRSTLNADPDFFSKNNIGDDAFNLNEYKVKCISLDNFVKKYVKKNPDLIGITVPGKIGVDILKGCTSLLKERQSIISMYIYDDELKSTKAYLNNFGYQQYGRKIGQMFTFVPGKLMAFKNDQPAD